MATINTIKRYLALCLWNDVAKYQELDVFCNNELMGKDFSMKFIRMTRWRQKAADAPLELEYRQHLDF
ncbi:unnamed protein product, partial [Mesorhabditis spiculigera]